jgi:hypothetical protein
MPKRFDDLIQVFPTAVVGGRLETVRESGETNHRVVQALATRLGYPETVRQSGRGHVDERTGALVRELYWATRARTK